MMWYPRAITVGWMLYEVIPTDYREKASCCERMKNDRGIKSMSITDKTNMMTNGRRQAGEEGGIWNSRKLTGL